MFPGWPTLVMLVLHISATCLFLSYLSLKNKSFTSSNTLPDENDHHEYRLLLESIHEYPMPFAIYDENDRLRIWNKHYENIYARVFRKFENTKDAKGLTYAEVLRGNLTDESVDPNMDYIIEQRVRAQRSGEQTLRDQQYPEYGWFRVTKYVTPSGGVAGIAIDINELKNRENELVREIEHRKQLEIEILKVANTDGLTGLANRRHFMERSREEFDKSESSNAVFSLLMIDVDHFKSINDTKGHAGGDQVLTMIAGAISAECRQIESLVGRVGGEEFTVLLPNTGSDEAQRLGETIRLSVEKLNFVIDDVSFGATVSLGVASTLSSGDLSLSNLLKDADQALYESKRNGRNRVSVSSAGRLPDRKAG